MSEGFKAFVESQKAKAPVVEPTVLDLSGTYAACRGRFNDQPRVEKLIKGLNGKRPDRMHCTIMYSRRHVPHDKVTPIIAMWDPKSASYRRCVSIQAFTDLDKTKPIGSPRTVALVLVLDAPMIIDMHNACMDIGGTHDYPDFHPHVSLLYGVPEDEARTAMEGIQASLDAEPLTVTLNSPYVEALKS